MSGAEIVKALGGHWRGRQGMCRCPAHDDRKPSMHVTELHDGTILLKCFTGCDQRAVIDALKQKGLWANDGEQRAPRRPRRQVIQPRPEISDDDLQRSIAAYDIWQRARPAQNSPVEAYLRGRAIGTAIPPSIRFSVLKHGPSGRILPALVGAVQSGERKITAVQRIFLKPDGSGKADVESAKMTLGPMLDGAVRLAAAGRVLGIAEGIETALSAMEIFCLPVWACLGASRMGSVAVPECVDHVVLFADQGDAGTKAAERAVETYQAQGLDVSVEAPDEHKDFNDMAQARSGKTRAA